MAIQQRLIDRAGTALPTVAARGGEVVAFRPRLASASELLTPSRPGPSAAESRPEAITTHGGCEFVVTAAMTDCFLARVHRVIEAGETAIVPLFHSGGVDMLVISAAAPLSVRPKDRSRTRST